jgi:mono/diheme cytochrome c family protein
MSSLSWSDRHLVLPIWASLYLTLAWTTWIQGQEQRSGSQSIDAGAAVIETHCVSCHSGASPEGSLDLSTRSGLLKGSESGMVLDESMWRESILWQQVSEHVMPPEERLSQAEIDAIAAWLAKQAPYPERALDAMRATSKSRAGFDWWSLLPLTKSTVDSNVRLGDWDNPIDFFVGSKLHERGWQLQAPASPRELIRRLYIDLVGLLPDPEEVKQFEEDCSEESYERLVDRLLASPQYGERWARHWLDIARYGESDGFERNYPRRNAWPYRDWVIAALNADLPYDQFVQMQIAGDLMGSSVAGIDSHAAAGFLVSGLHNTVVGSSARMQQLARQDELEEILGTVGQTFLGLTLHCARCHDHKFDPIRQEDYYRMAASISGVFHGEKPRPDHRIVEQLDPLITKLATMRMDRLAWEQEISQRAAPKPDSATKVPPAASEPTLRWSFDETDAQSQRLRMLAGAELRDGALQLDGTGYAATESISMPMSAKTLEVWVTPATLDQSGGGVLSTQTTDGILFDAIVYAELEPKKWMAGSNNFSRTKSFDGAQEDLSNGEPIHLAIAYAEDGSIRGYRNGKPYGNPYQGGGLLAMQSGNWQVLFGLRHGEAGGNRLFRGAIHEARLYDRALVEQEIAASFEAGFAGSRQQLLADRMDAEEQKRWEQMREEERKLSADISRLQAQRDRTLHTVVAKDPAPIQLLGRGDIDQPRGEMMPGGIQAIGFGLDRFQWKEKPTDAERRAALAGWIGNRKQPLLARVIVNRIFHHHFGQGLVATPNDFGFQGGLPSHPELLDWMAQWLVDHDMQWKALHRTLLLSATYRQSSQFLPDRYAVDADNRWLWRYPPRRLEAEVLRDQMLQLANSLDRQLHGPPFIDVSIQENNGSTYYEPLTLPETGMDPSWCRRTIYRFSPRGGGVTLLELFDSPDCAITSPKRASSSTPLQALALLNNPLVEWTSEQLAKRAQEFDRSTADQQIRWLYLQILSREPTGDELNRCLSVARSQRMATVARVLLNTSEFLWLGQGRPSESQGTR